MKKNLKYLLFLIIFTVISCGDGGSGNNPDTPPEQKVTDWRDEVIYFMMTDRFNDGDPSNNSQMSDGLDYDAGNGKTYQGGDFKGIIEKMDYLSELGITAIWITPPVKQVWEDGGYAGYHGYWAQDFQSVDPHLGTLDDFKNMVKAAHDKNIKVIMDIVINHTGSLFYYPDESDQWNPSFNQNSSYNIAWLEEVPGADWAITGNRVKPMPIEFQNPEWFTRKGGNNNDPDQNTDDYIYNADFSSLKNIDTSRNDVKEKFIEIYKWWITETGVDGFRIDTVKHVEHDFWKGFCNEMRTWASEKNFYMLGEVIKHPVDELANYTNNNQFDSVLAYSMADASFREYSSHSLFKGSWAGRPKASDIKVRLDEIKGQDNFNAASLHAGGDGLTARQKMGYFIDMHTMNRFNFDTSGISNADATDSEIKELQLALGWLLTWEGLPTIYYGTEQNYKQTLIDDHGTGSGNCEKGNRPRLWEIKNTSNGNNAFDTTNSTFKIIKGLNQLRKENIELRRGAVSIKWADEDGDGSGADDGILAYVKSGYTDSLDDDILIIINTNADTKSAYTSDTDFLGTDWPVGTVLEVVDIPGYHNNVTVNDGTSEVTEVTTVAQGGKTSALNFSIPAGSIRILKVKQ